MNWQGIMFIRTLQVPGDVTLTMDEKYTEEKMTGRNTAKRLISFSDLGISLSAKNFCMNYKYFCCCTKKY